MTCKFLGILATFLFSSPVWAGIWWGLDAEVGRSSGLAAVSLSENREGSESWHFSQWNMSFTTSQAKSEDSVTGEISTTRGRDLSAGAGIAYNRSWNFDLSVMSSTTPETDYRQSGAHLQTAYRYESEKLLVQPGIVFGKSKINQKLSFKILNAFVNRDVELEQQELGAFLLLAPWEWFSVRVDGSIFSYSKSKEQLQTAYASRFLNYYTSDLISNIGGLPEYSASAELVFLFSPRWDVSYLAQRTHLIVDDSESVKNQLILTYSADSWSLGGGMSQLRTSQSNEGSLVSRWTLEL